MWMWMWNYKSEIEFFILNFWKNSPKVRESELESEEELVFKQIKNYIFVESENSIFDL